VSDLDQYPSDGNKGESEGVPEALQDREGDRDGANDNRRWRYAVRELEAMDYTGPGIWRQIGPAPLQVGRHQVFQGPGPASGEVVDIALDPRGGDTRTIYAAAGNGGLWKSTDGGTSLVYTGLTWDVFLTQRLFVEGSFGGAIHDGDDHQFGCTVDFRESGSVGLMFGKHWELMATVDHMSNADLCDENRGLTTVGLRLGRKL